MLVFLMFNIESLCTPSFLIDDWSVSNQKVTSITSRVMVDTFPAVNLLAPRILGIWTKVLSKYLVFWLDVHYRAHIYSNTGYFLYTVSVPNKFSTVVSAFFFFKLVLKVSFFLTILHTIFFITNLENYFKQIKTVNMLTKLFILNVTEKEVGPVDDYFFFAVLFILTTGLFIFTSVFLLILQSSILTWAVGAFFLVTVLILTIPTSLFIDFGIVFCVTIRGSAPGNNLIKELASDLMSVTTVFIRFVIQNIRFLFIFAGIFELLEWVITTNNNIFLSSSYLKNNLFVVDDLSTSFSSLNSLSFLLLNSVLAVVLYMYYVLHLLFLLLVQVTIYVGISIWLFFFLYSTKFLARFEYHLSAVK